MDSYFKLPEGSEIVAPSDVPAEVMNQLSAVHTAQQAVPEGALTMSEFIRQSSPQDLFKMVIDTKDTDRPFDPKAFMRDHPELDLDEEINQKLADVDAYVRDRGFEWSDLSLKKGLSGLWEMAKSIANRPFQFSGTAYEAGMLIGKKVTGQDTAQSAEALVQTAKKEYGELQASREAAAFDFISMFPKAYNKGKEVLGSFIPGITSAIEENPRERYDNFRSRVDLDRQRQRIAEGRGATFEAFFGSDYADTLKKYGSEIDPDQVNKLSASDPMVLVAFPGGLKAVSAASGKVLFKAASMTEAGQLISKMRLAERVAAKATVTSRVAARARGQIVKSASQLGPAGAAAAGPIIEEAGQVAQVAAGAEAAAKAASEAAKAAVQANRTARFALGASEVGRKAGDWLGKMAQRGVDKTLGYTLTAVGGVAKAGEAAGKTVAAFLPPIATPRALRTTYEALGQFGQKAITKAGPLRSGELIGYGPRTRLISDTLGTGIDVTGGAARGFLTFDLPLAVATSERPEDTAHMPLFAAALGGIGRLPRGAQRVVAGQLIAPRQQLGSSTLNDYGHISVLDALTRYASERDETGRTTRRLNALRQYLAPFKKEVYYVGDDINFEPGDPRRTQAYRDALHRLVFQDANGNPIPADQLTPRQKQWLDQSATGRGVNLNVRDDAGNVRRISVARELDAGSHEVQHMLKDILGERTYGILRDILYNQYLPIWEQFGESYVRKFIGEDGLRKYAEAGEGWREAIIDLSDVLTPEQRKALTPEQIEGLSNEYVADEFLADVGAAVLDNAGPGLLTQPGLPGTIARTLAATLEQFGVEPFGEVKTPILGVDLTYRGTEAIRQTLAAGLKEARQEQKRPNVMEHPKYQRGGKTTVTPKTGTKAPPTARTPQDFQDAAAEASPTPVGTNVKSPQEILNSMADLLNAGKSAVISYYAAPGEAARFVESQRPERRAEIEAARGKPKGERVLVENVEIYPERIDTSSGGVKQIIAWSRDVWNANARKLANAVVSSGQIDWWNNEYSRYQIDGKTKTFTDEAWNNLQNDLEVFSANQRAGFTGAGSPLVVPREVEAAGFRAPEMKGLGREPLDQREADIVSMLFGIKLPATPRIGNVYPRNLAGQKVSAATLPGRVSPVTPERTFTGPKAEALGVEGEQIREVNPERAKLEAKGIKPSVIESLQRFNLDYISDIGESGARPAPGVEFTLQAGFAPGEGVPFSEPLRIAAEVDTMKLTDLITRTQEYKTGPYGGGLTGLAYSLGASLKTPQDLAVISGYEARHNAAAAEARAAKDYTKMGEEASKTQFYREAREFATGTGSAKVRIDKAYPGYTPPLTETGTQKIGGQFAPPPEALKDREHITMAAIRTPQGDIYTGVMHGHAYDVAGISPIEANRPIALKAMEEGFMTSKDRFVGREEAFRIGDKAQQIARDSLAASRGKFLSLDESRPVLEADAFNTSRKFATPEDLMPADTNPPPQPERRVPGEAFSRPQPNYKQASAGNDNPWVRRTSAESNKGRQLLVQIASDLIYSRAAKEGAINDEGAASYYDTLYSGTREGYTRPADFWEIPQWAAFVSKILPDADFYVVRDVAAAKQFLDQAGYDRVMFSALDVNKNIIKDVISDYRGQVDVGGYVDPGEFAGKKNVKWHDNLKSLADDMGVPYVEGTDYRHFQGTEVIPRLTLSDGCKYKCAFCAVPKKVVPATDESVMSQAESLGDLGAKLVYLNDKTFGQSPNYKMLPKVRQVIEAKNPDFKGFVIQTTAEMLPKLGADFIRDAGIKLVELGVESYNDPILRELRKPANERVIDKAVQALREQEVALIPNIVIGFPGETAETYARTLQWLKDNADIISHANIYNLALYKNSELGRKMTTATDGDFNENVLEKSWMEDVGIHKTFAGDVYGFAEAQLKGGYPKGAKFAPKEGDRIKHIRDVEELWPATEPANKQVKPAAPIEAEVPPASRETEGGRAAAALAARGAFAPGVKFKEGDKPLLPEEAGFGNFWVSPSGEFYPAGDHRQWAYDRVTFESPKERPVVPTMMKPKGSPEAGAEEALKNMGWVRVSREREGSHDAVFLDGARSFNEKQNSAFEVWSAENPDVEIVDTKSLAARKLGAQFSPTMEEYEARRAAEKKKQVKPVAVTPGQKKFRMEKSADGFSKAWILPNGEPVQLGGQWHHDWMNENAKSISDRWHIPLKVAKASDIEGAREGALKAGFARINLDTRNGSMTIELRAQDLRKLRNSITDFVDANAGKIDNIKVTLMNGDATKVLDTDSLPVFRLDDAEKADNIPLVTGSEVKPRATYAPPAEQEGLPGMNTPREVLSPAARSQMSLRELRQHFPEAYVPRALKDEVPSAIVESPLYKSAKNEAEAVELFADRLVEFAEQYKDNPEFQAGAKWYSEFTPMLKELFGKDADVMAELLAATSPNTGVEVNFAYAFDAFKSLKDGRFDKQIAKFNEGMDKIADGSWEPWIKREINAGNVPKPPENPSAATFLEHWVFKNKLKPTQSNGKLYGQHSIPVLQVFTRRWMDANRGPKTRNFVENLLGVSDEATIDVWADRTMRWAGYEGKQDRWRILPENGTGVSDADFYFSQKAFRRAAEKLGMKPSDLQGALWFAEKRRWSDNGWGRLELGDFRKEMEKIPLLEKGYEQRIRVQKAQKRIPVKPQVELFGQ